MRRTAFLGAAAGLTVAGTAGGALRTALAEAPAERVLVVVDLQGGNDGLNTVVPHGLPAYYRLRPTLGVPPSDVLRIDETVGLNPALKPLKAAYDDGKLAIVQGVGYPNPDLSHFRSTEIWQTAAPNRFEPTGWLGRFLDAAVPGGNLFAGVAISDVLPEAMLALETDVPAISQLAGYGLLSDRNPQARSTLGSLVADRHVPFTSPYLARAAEVEEHAQRGSEELPRLIGSYAPAAIYPGSPLGRSLALAAQIVSGRCGTRVIYVRHGSYDTHTSQRPTHDRLLADLAESLAAFSADLTARGNADRVLTMTFSEFGRRAAENASRGTDHGTAAPLFLLGPGVRGGLYGAQPSLDDLEGGNLRFGTDFRSVYAAVLERWLEHPSAPILGGSFAPVTALG